MTFDFIIGNPPYGNGQDKIFYRKFIKKSAERLLKPNAVMTFVVPWNYTFSGLCRKMAQSGYFHSIEQIDGNSTFGINMTTPLCTFLYEKGAKVKGSAPIQLHQKWAIDPIALSIVNKILQDGIKPINGRGDMATCKKGIFELEKSETHTFPVYLSSKEWKRCVWSSSPAKGAGISKLIVSWLLWAGKAESFSEFSKEKGVGRKGKYFEGSEIQAANYVKYFNSEIHIFIESILRKGKITAVGLALPNIDWTIDYNDNALLVRLTSAEITFMKRALK
jgi:hypothetical protein